MAGPTPHPFIKAFAVAGGVLAVALVALYSIFGLPNPYKAGVVEGYFAMAAALPAAIAGYFARRSAKIWPAWKIAGLYFAILVAIIFVLVFNQLKTL